ncbi:hypothetical protein [Motiliproteus sp. MSK22-1]|uniref:hypothetical protein n=1 Tax=Motiliproteus sp. MSK22-1 TaxID=1897630 RepID=UPI000977348C|nr:hypothetical protein [Motiliproteus sp. MSK22-1]OMH28354.1 hypothetical protein BGP75_20835 [Motiliproteus sp. MSK22-1]
MNYNRANLEVNCLFQPVDSVIHLGEIFNQPLQNLMLLGFCRTSIAAFSDNVGAYSTAPVQRVNRLFEYFLHSLITKHI